MQTPTDQLRHAIAALPPGPWAVGVSGGADSVALLRLCHDRPDLSIHIVHLDHQTRGHASAADAAFVADLARQLNIPCTLATRHEIEPVLRDPPGNPSALYRALRLELYGRVVRDHALHGVILAHHADDQAETIFLRLLRGSGATGLAGMRPTTAIGNLLILRPLLNIPRQVLRDYLTEIAQPWREDASNLSDDYDRNRIRKLLAQFPSLTQEILHFGAAMQRWRDYLTQGAPTLEKTWRITQVQRLWPPLAAESIRRWLTSQGAPPDQLSPKTIEKIIAMATDAAMPARLQVPGALVIRRRTKFVSLDRPPTSAPP